MTDIYLIAGADENYAMPMTVSLHSALHHLDPACRAHVYVVDGGISPDSQARCKRALEAAHPSVDLRWITPDLTQYDGLNVGRYTSASLLRLMIPDIVPEGCDRALYIDSDVVVDDDLSQLWALDLEDKPFWAVPNLGPDHFETRIRDKFPFLNAPKDARYLNSGVLLLNIGPWKAQNVTGRTLEFLSAHGAQLSFPDQDALNAANAGQWGYLEGRWNAQVHNESFADGQRGITHYTSFKPWTRKFTGQRKWNFFQAYLRTGWNNPFIAIPWTGLRLTEQIIRHNIKRIDHRLMQR
jgi:lipopolysaccharide biosynthesis glycosyltransferase